MSQNLLLGKPSHFKDDLESIVYIAIYFLKGNLPWSNVFNDKLENL